MTKNNNRHVVPNPRGAGTSRPRAPSGPAPTTTPRPRQSNGPRTSWATGAGERSSSTALTAGSAIATPSTRATTRIPRAIGSTER